MASGWALNMRAELGPSPCRYKRASMRKRSYYGRVDKSVCSRANSISFSVIRGQPHRICGSQAKSTHSELIRRGHSSQSVWMPSRERNPRCDVRLAKDQWQDPADRFSPGCPMRTSACAGRDDTSTVRAGTAHFVAQASPAARYLGGIAGTLWSTVKDGEHRITVTYCA
jgi:hypothetical protein